MIKDERFKEQILYCVDEKLETLYHPSIKDDENLLKLAFSFYKAGYVNNVKFSEHDSVLATVQHNQVEFLLDFTELSECTCHKDMCAHIIAVAFYLYSYYKSPEKFIEQWLKPSQKNHKIKEPTHFQEESLSDWIDYLNAKSTFFLKDELDSMDFFNRFQKEFYLCQSIVEHFYPKMLQEAPKDIPAEILFDLHVALTSVIKILEVTEDSYLNNHQMASIQQIIQQIIDDINEMIIAIHEEERYNHPIVQQILEEGISRFGELLFVSKNLMHDRLFLFRLLWSSLLNNEKYISTYQQALTKRLEHEHEYRTECQIALAHFEFMRRNDQKALARLENLDPYDITHCGIWLTTLLNSEKLERFEQWNPFILQKMEELFNEHSNSDHKKKIVDYFLHIYNQYAEKTDSHEVFLQVLEAWLPYSYSTYSNFTLMQEDFKKWTELQLYLGINIDYIDRDDLRLIEKTDRSFLLPLYHHAIEEQIALKNRSAYKQAVKYLKKLRAHYRQLKKVELWEHYLANLAIKYKRLRAFQEELRKGKGKLIDD